MAIFQENVIDPIRTPQSRPEPPRIGTSGWSVPRVLADAFPSGGSGLERYAHRFNCVEINSTFYRSHRAATYDRWLTATPAGFRFAVKLSKTITHDARLVVGRDDLAARLEELRQLEPKLGPVLVQLPPSLAFDADVARRFLDALRELYAGEAVLEPRHVSWFEPQADTLLAEHKVARVAADPKRHPLAGEPGGWLGLAYWRWHGSPRLYYSAYDEDALESLAAELTREPARPTWCFFDNTVSGAAAANALQLKSMVKGCDADER
jgi:uncharacterized protein YecE (DUF72 family)